ncbi:hypothetical protein C0Z17_02760 [Trinickia caryophylli]|nr:hypothetical protein C0Z17_02760 [Trinickia caryophylli]
MPEIVHAAQDGGEADHHREHQLAHRAVAQITGERIDERRVRREPLWEYQLYDRAGRGHRRDGNHPV